MKLFDGRFISVALVSLILNSCDKPSSSDAVTAAQGSGSKPNIKSALGTKSVQEALGNQFLSVKTCDALEKTLEELTENSEDIEFNPNSSQSIVMTIKEPDPRDLKRDIKKNGNSVPVPQPNPGGKKPSKWDFDVNLPGPTYANGVTTYATGLITIKLANNTSGDYIFRFVDPRYAIRAGNIAGALMFCDSKVVGDTATMTVVRIPDSGISSGSFSFGIIIQDKNDSNYEIPVYFDPDVKNEG